MGGRIRRNTHRETGQEGRALYKLALARGYEQPQRGAALARRALARIDAAGDPRLDLAIRHTLIWFLNDSGAPRRALDLLTAARPLYRRLGESAPDRLMPWIEARLCRSLGELAAAERGFAAVWHALQPADRNLDLTLVTLDLVDAYLAQNKLRAAQHLLRSFHDNLLAWQLHAQGLAAWAALMGHAAAGSGRARDLIPPSALYFRRAWHRPLPPRR